jgi:hypothetical protein
VVQVDHNPLQLHTLVEATLLVKDFLVEMTLLQILPLILLEVAEALVLKVEILMALQVLSVVLVVLVFNTLHLLQQLQLGLTVVTTLVEALAAITLLQTQQLLVV